MDFTRNKILLSNLSADTTHHKINGLFKKFGKIAKLYIVRKDPTGKTWDCDGRAYIAYESAESAAKAVEEMNGEVFDDSIVMVEFATDREYLQEVKVCPKPTDKAAHPKGSAPTEVSTDMNEAPAGESQWQPYQGPHPVDTGFHLHNNRESGLQHSSTNYPKPGRLPKLPDLSDRSADPISFTEAHRGRASRNEPRMDRGDVHAIREPLRHSQLYRDSVDEGPRLNRMDLYTDAPRDRRVTSPVLSRDYDTYEVRRKHDDLYDFPRRRDYDHERSRSYRDRSPLRLDPEPRSSLSQRGVYRDEYIKGRGTRRLDDDVLRQDPYARDPYDRERRREADPLYERPSRDSARGRREADPLYERPSRDSARDVYREPTRFRDDYLERARAREDYREPVKGREDYRKPAIARDEYRQQALDREPVRPRDDYRESAVPREDYREPAKAIVDYGEPTRARARVDYGEPVTARVDYREPVTARVDYREPVTARVDYREPALVREEYREPIRHDYREPAMADYQGERTPLGIDRPTYDYSLENTIGADRPSYDYSLESEPDLETPSFSTTSNSVLPVEYDIASLTQQGGLVPTLSTPPRRKRFDVRPSPDIDKTPGPSGSGQKVIKQIIREYLINEKGQKILREYEREVLQEDPQQTSVCSPVLQYKDADSTSEPKKGLNVGGDTKIVWIMGDLTIVNAETDAGHQRWPPRHLRDIATIVWLGKADMISEHLPNILTERLDNTAPHRLPDLLILQFGGQELKLRRSSSGRIVNSVREASNIILAKAKPCRVVWSDLTRHSVFGYTVDKRLSLEMGRVNSKVQTALLHLGRPHHIITYHPMYENVDPELFRSLQLTMLASALRNFIQKPQSIYVQGNRIEKLLKNYVK